MGVLDLSLSPGKVAFLYPGQASQYVGMGADIYEKFDSVKSYYSRASEALGFDLAEISFNGPIEELTQTSVTQPAIFTHSYSLSMLLADKGIKPDFAAGHSLGEYAAYASAGSLEFPDAIHLVKVRADSMQKACDENPGTMAAVIGMELETLETICAQENNDGVVNIANLNSPVQLVVSGEIDPVREVMAIAREQGAKIVKELNVGGAFHSPLMESAVEEFSQALESVSISSPEFPVYTNVSGEPLFDPEEIKHSLIKQLTSPVRWYPSMLNMADAGAAEFIEIGPGKVLQGLTKRTNKEFRSSGVDRLEDLGLILN